MTESVVCKYCQSLNVRKYGKYKDTQYYYCNISLLVSRCIRLFRVLYCHLSRLAGVALWKVVQDHLIVICGRDLKGAVYHAGISANGVTFLPVRYTKHRLKTATSSILRLILNHLDLRRFGAFVSQSLWTTTSNMLRNLSKASLILLLSIGKSLCRIESALVGFRIRHSYLLKNTLGYII